MKTALIAGGTGLIGSQLLQLLLESDRYDKVIAITRKELPIHKKLISIQVNPANFGKVDTTARIDDVYCCLGTTMAKARSKEKFYQIDFTFPVSLAKNALTQGAQQYLLVSALGADKDASIYYNKVKGEVEAAIAALKYTTFHVFRPSLLLGPRIEKRSGEDAAKFFYKVFGFLIPTKYKGIESIKVANAMLHFASQEKKGHFIHESKELQVF
jgi:uncharacterized protein YbjT (DUF2867 family)